MKTCKFPNLPFRDQIWRINFEDGREPAFISTYNVEITGWTDNAPEEIKLYGRYLSIHLQDKLSSRGMAFYFEGFNASQRNHNP